MRNDETLVRLAKISPTMCSALPDDLHLHLRHNILLLKTQPQITRLGYASPNHQRNYSFIMIFHYFDFCNVSNLDSPKFTSTISSCQITSHMREAGQATGQTSYGSNIRVQLILSISYQSSVSSTHVANDLLQLETLTQTCA
jgi:hypothetical protein